jgi:hypothetical protein
MFRSVLDLQSNLLSVLNNPNNVFDDDDLLCRGAPAVLSACIEELEELRQRCDVMKNNFQAFLDWIHPQSSKAAKPQDVLKWFETFIKCVRECNSRNTLLWVEDSASVSSSLTATTVSNDRKSMASNILSEQINDDSLEEFLAQSAKRIGINM